MGFDAGNHHLEAESKFWTRVNSRRLGDPSKIKSEVIRLHSVWLNTMNFAGGRSLEFRRGKAMSLTGGPSDDFRRIWAEMALRHVGVSRALECALDLSFSSTLHDEFCATNSHLTIV